MNSTSSKFKIMKLFQSIKLSRNNYILLLTFLFGSFLYYWLANENINVESTSYLSSNYKMYFNVNNYQNESSNNQTNQQNESRTNTIHRSEVCPIIPPNLGINGYHFFLFK